MSDRITVASDQDVVRVRQLVRTVAVSVKLSLVDQTKLVTAASELARNMVEHGHGGTVLIEAIDDGTRRGLRLTFEDTGPGIPSLQDALRDGFTTGGGMGLGLGGARRLSNEFDIQTEVGKGTRVMIARWRGVT